ncbi:hypothetical protein [Pinibacter soli]|uniref:GLPGLI family protein n=1 Tax=Pinibacter soli TaxID=3044211 RepID=A0ABT6R880_9BACT|nr:hypothetical protein [Pinibacter soli]MDI3318768.1 hypothetical protein [Pinibacter soli]
MYKKIITVLCVLFAMQSLHSQTITTTELLNKKLLNFCVRSSPSVTSIYYLEYRIQGDSLIDIDAGSITNALFKEKILEFYEENTSNISWKSILKTDGSCSKIMRVVHPIFVLVEDDKGVRLGADDILPEFVNLFSKKIFNSGDGKGAPFIMMQPWIYMFAAKSL